MGILFVMIPREVIVIFLVCVSFWVDNPRTLAGVGLATVICQLITYLLGTLFYPVDDNHDHHDHHFIITDDSDKSADEKVQEEDA